MYGTGTHCQSRVHPPRETSACVMMEALAPGGRCAVVVPEGLLFGSTGAHKDLRRKLLTDFELLAVVSLPAGVFKPYAGVKTAVLVFRRPPEGATPSLDKVWFYEVTNDGYDPDKISDGARPETPIKNEIPALMRAWAEYRDSGFKKPPGVEANALLEPGSDEPDAWWATLETIEANDWNLAAGRFKPRVGEAAPDEDPRELTNHCIELEGEIQAGLQALLLDLTGDE